MKIEEKIEQIEISMGKAKKDINLMKALDRLGSNPDFKEVILDGYFCEEAQRLVMLKSHPSTQDAESQLSIIRGIDSIGILRQFFLARIQEGRLAEKAIEEDEETIEDLRREDLV